VIIFQHANRLIGHVTKPIMVRLPEDHLFGMPVIDILSVLLLLFICFVAGLLATTPLASRFVRALEDRFLSKVPAYEVARIKFTAPLRFDEAGELRPVLVRFDDLSQIGFEIERLEDGKVVVYIPGAPDPWSGTVSIVTADRVSEMGASSHATLISFKQLGKGTGKLLSA
jgi:uncharacterized membrane protein